MARRARRVADRPAEWPGLGRRDLGAAPAHRRPRTRRRSTRSPAAGRPALGRRRRRFPARRTILLRADAGRPHRAPSGTSWPTWRSTRRSAVRVRSGSTRGTPRGRPASGTASIGSSSTWPWPAARSRAPRPRRRAPRLPGVDADAAYALAASAVTRAGPPEPDGHARRRCSPAWRRGERFDDAVARHDRPHRSTGSSEAWRRSVRTPVSGWSPGWSAGGAWIVVAVLVWRWLRGAGAGRTVPAARRAGRGLGGPEPEEPDLTRRPEPSEPPRPEVGSRTMTSAVRHRLDRRAAHAG